MAYKALYEEGSFDAMPEPEVGLKDDFWNPKWIPVTTMGTTEHHCIDLDPGPGGTVGQIILWNRDGHRSVVARSFKEWLEQFAQDLEEGHYPRAEKTSGSGWRSTSSIPRRGTGFRVRRWCASTRGSPPKWRDEVTPAVGSNLLSPAGEWAGWDRDWLVATIQRVQRERAHRPHVIGALVDAVRLGKDDGAWFAIARCMNFLRSVDSGEERERRARGLVTLARHGFDFAVTSPSEGEDEAREFLAALYPKPFLDLFATVIGATERSSVERRIEAALSPTSSRSRS